jgi:hypothetical protein
MLTGPPAFGFVYARFYDAKIGHAARRERSFFAFGADFSRDVYPNCCSDSQENAFSAIAVRGLARGKIPALFCTPETL